MNPILELRQVNKFFGEHHVLKDISFQVMPGELIGYIGPNGAGKSTTVKIVLGLLAPDSGEVLFEGVPVTGDDVSYKAKIGYVPEQTALYDTLTLREYIMFTGLLYGMNDNLIKRRSESMLASFELEDALDKRLGAFSKGMRQKALILCSLLHDPDLLFWDEPLSGLDANTVLLVKEIMLKLAEMGKALFYSSHNMDTVEKLSQRILLLNEGRIIADGSLADISGSATTSLEDFFSQVTGFTDHDRLAAQFLSGF